MLQIVETPYNIYFDQALNCVRVLTRVTPFIFEKVKNSTRKEIHDLCWSTKAEEAGQEGGDDDADEGDDESEVS